ncbi:MAG: ABC transporter permease [Anaerolineae bacterium]|nr:ABC transporter permease [Anaerolineae bacterium]
MNIIRTIIIKEWLDVRRNKLVLSVVLFVPLLMAAIPIAMLIIMARVPISQSDYQELGPMLENPLFAGLTPTEAMQSVLSSNYLVLFLMMPLMVPVTIAAYSIVGEKITRSLEPLLATPISTAQLLLGKGLAAALPGVVTAWFSYGIFLIFARIFSVSDRVFRIFIDPMWLVAMFVLAPLLTVMAVNVGIIVSSRTSDPRAAEQLGSLVILPLMVLFIGPLVGFIQLNSATFWIASLIVLVLDAGLLYLGVKLFQRETILTRWK